MVERFARLSVNVQTAPDEAGGPLSRTIPNLQRLCGAERYPAPLRYGQPLPDATARNVGRFVRLGTAANAPIGVIVGSATPVKPTLHQLARGSSSLCDPSYVVEVEGARLVANARQVREVNRSPRGGLCPYHAALDAVSLGAVVAEARKGAGARHPRELLPDLPYPHRVGSGPCCAASDVTPEKVLELLEAWETGEAGDNMTGRDMLALARRAVPRSSSVEVPRRVADIRKAMGAVRDHCFAQWERKASEALVPRVEKFQRLKADVRAKYRKAK